MGDGRHYDYGFRIYNPAIAKFLSVDPLTATYPWYTPYQFAGNSPIKFVDLDGLEPGIHELYSYSIPTPNSTNINIAVGANTRWAHGAVQEFDLVAPLDFDGKITFAWDTNVQSYVNKKHGSYREFADRWQKAEGNRAAYYVHLYAEGSVGMIEQMTEDPVGTVKSMAEEEIDLRDLDPSDFIGPRRRGNYSRASSNLSGRANFNRGSRNFVLEQGNSKSGWKHIYDRHIDRDRFVKKSKFESNLGELEIKGLLNKTLKHGKESLYEGKSVFNYRTKNPNGNYRKYRATVNEDGTVQTFHPLD